MFRQKKIRLRVVIESNDSTNVRVKSLAFKLDGTDDLGDLESLALFSTGDKLDFASTTAFGEPTRPSATITFLGERTLTAGKNVFWLACRIKPTAKLSHRVVVTCSMIETSGGRLIPRDQSPGVRHRIGVALRRHNDDEVHTYRIPALATSASKRVFIAGPTVAGLLADNWLHAAKVGIDAILTDYPLELRSSLQQPKATP